MAEKKRKAKRFTAKVVADATDRAWQVGYARGLVDGEERSRAEAATKKGNLDADKLRTQLEVLKTVQSILCQVGQTIASINGHL